MNVAVLEVDDKEVALLSARSAGRGIELVRSETVPVQGDLKGALARLRGAEKRVILVVPRAQAILRDFELPASTQEELIQMVRFQVEKEMPLPPDQIRYSFVETGRSEGKVRVQVAAVPNRVLAPILDGLAAADIRVDVATVSTFGLANLVAGRAEPVVVFGASGQTAEVFVYDGGTVALSRSASLPKELPMKDFVDNEVQRTILAWQARGEGRKVPAVVDATTREGLGLNGELLSRENVFWDSRTPALAGVCLGAITARAPMPDLLHPPVAVKRIQIPKAWRIGGLAVAVLGLVIFLSQKILADKDKELKSLQGQLRLRKPEVDQVKRKDANTRIARQWREDRFPWAQLFLELHKTKLKKEQLQLTAVTVGEKGSVTITGKAQSPEVYEIFRSELEGSSYLKSVKTAGPLTPISEGTYRNKFTLKAELKE